MVTTAGLLGAGALAAAGGIGSSVLGYLGMKKAAKAQEDAAETAAEAQTEINNKNIKFQQTENAITRAREDNAHQREVNDLMSAGLSPLANLTGAGAASMTAPSADASGFIASAEHEGQAGAAMGNAISSIGTGFDRAVGNYSQLKQQQISESVANSQIAYNNAKTEEQNINNSTLAFKNASEMVSLLEKIKGQHYDNKFLKAKADNAIEFIKAEISSMSNNARNALSQARLHEQQHTFNAEDEEFFNDLGLPKKTSVSFNATSIPGVTQVTTRNAARLYNDSHNDTQVSRQKADVLRVSKDQAKSAAEEQFETELKRYDEAIEAEKQYMREHNIVSNTERLKQLYSDRKAFNTKKMRNSYLKSSYEKFGLLPDGSNFKK